MDDNMIVDSETGEIVEANDAHSRHLRIVALRKSAEQTFLDMGKELYYFEAEGQYIQEGYDTFEDYLASPDVDIERRTAFMIKGAYKTFVKELGVQPVALLPAGYSKLEIIRSRVTPENVEALLADAVALSRSDLIEKMGQTKHSKVSSTKHVTKTPPQPAMTVEDRINSSGLFGTPSATATITGPTFTGLARDFEGTWKRWVKTGLINRDNEIVVTVQFRRKSAS